MGAPEPMTGLSPPPPDRDLPDLPRHRRELLAVIAGRQGLRRAPRWAVPLAAAVAVAAAALVPVFGHRQDNAPPGGATRAARGAAAACQKPPPAPSASGRTPLPPRRRPAGSPCWTTWAR
jgi:hypothetical protein